MNRIGVPYYFAIEILLRGYYSPNLSLLSKNYQNLFEKIIYAKKLPIKLKSDIEILVGQVVFSYESKQSKYCFD